MVSSIVFRMDKNQSATIKKPKNPFRISLNELANREGYANSSEFIITLDDSVVPACCSEGCEVEPDGRCEHGCPSALLAFGII